MGNPVKVAVVVVNYNAGNHLENCLSRLRDQTLQPFKHNGVPAPAHPRLPGELQAIKKVSPGSPTKTSGTVAETVTRIKLPRGLAAPNY